MKNNIINTRLFSRQSSSFHGYNQSQPKLEAYEIAKTSSITMPVIILVNPFLDQNVGSVSRAMLNFGLHELRIVDPACNITSENALALAAGAYEVLDNAKVFPTLEEAISDLQRVFATTVRLRALNHIIYTPRAAAEVIINLPTPSEDNEQDEQTTPIKCGILFGRERNGLYNEEVNLADSIISIPTFNHFTSLNLAQAVNIVGYELWNRKIALDQSAAPPVWFQPKSGDRLARKVELDNFLTRLEKRLVDREYQKEKSREALYFQIIRNIFQRVCIHMLIYICAIV